MNILGKDYDKVLYVHIPKTAGSSITKVLKENNLDNWKRSWPRHHDPYFYLKEHNDINDTIFSFSVVRNPYTRTYSCFHQYNKANNTNISFVKYLDNILQNIISPISPLLHLSQSFYVIENDTVMVNKLYHFENLKELELDLKWQLDFHNVGNYQKDLYYTDYTDEAIEITQSLYEKDFSYFGYSKNFTEILETT